MAKHYPPRRAPRTGSTRAWRELRLRILKRDGYVCQGCGQRATHVDHIVPYARGGSDQPSNLRAMCGPCNSSHWYE